jgi:hypothetical protein
MFLVEILAPDFTTARFTRRFPSCNIVFLLYPLNTSMLNTKFFNFFIDFLAKPVSEINKEIVDPIL